MKTPLLQCETRVCRTYRGGRLLEEFLGKSSPKDSFCPEDWISSFVQAQNPKFIPGEGISRVMLDGRAVPITEAVGREDFGPGRAEGGVLIKYLDSAERLGIQVHPTPEFSKKHFGTPYGKTECWHILGTRGDAAVYIGFKEGITREKWEALYRAQDVEGMLNALHRFSVRPGDTVLVRAGTPHAIDAGCFLLEIQEPTDYTMRVERTTAAGATLTPRQIHYGVGESAMLDCFVYEGYNEEQARSRYFLPQRRTAQTGREILAGYADTPCFALERLFGEGVTVSPESFLTAVILREGTVRFGTQEITVKRGEKYFVPYGSGDITVNRAEVLLCYPPEK